MTDIVCKLIDKKFEYHIYEDKKYLDIFSIESDAQENYIRIKKMNNYYLVEEVHRDNVVSVYETDDCNQAKVVLSVLAIKMYRRMPKDENVRLIREAINNGLYEKAEQMIEIAFPKISFKVEEENDEGFALIKNHNSLYSLKYKGNEVIKEMSAARGFSVLYAYCRDVEYIRNWYLSYKEVLDGVLEYSVLENIFLGNSL